MRDGGTTGDQAGQRRFIRAGRERLSRNGTGLPNCLQPWLPKRKPCAVNVVAAFLMIAHPAPAAIPADQAVETGADALRRREPVARPARARVRIMKAARVRFEDGDISIEPGSAAPQRRADRAGQVWFDFS